VLPLKDNVPTRSTPILTIGLIVANVLMWVLYQDAGSEPGLTASVNELAYHPCEVERSCPTVGEDWHVTALTSMFMHGSWGHLLGNMLFLWIFGNNVEDELGKIRFILFYVLGGLAATASQTVVTLGWASDAEATIPNVGASPPRT
jgi:membrane associated rhomboid family serine protease